MKTQLLILTISLVSVLGIAQQNELTKLYKSQVISQICLEIENRYVYLEKAKLIKAHLQNLDNSNHFTRLPFPEYLPTFWFVRIGRIV